jgi:hypothetical protein
VGEPDALWEMCLFAEKDLGGWACGTDAGFQDRVSGLSLGASWLQDGLSSLHL